MRRVLYFAPLVAVVVLVVAALAVDAGCSAEPEGSQASSRTQITVECFNARSMELPDELFRGAIDIHVHAGPHLKSSPRRVDPVQAARQSKAAGMRGLVYMVCSRTAAVRSARCPAFRSCVLQMGDRAGRPMV